MYVENGYQLFIDERELMGVRPKTIQFYEESAGRMVRFIIEERGNIPVAQMQEPVLHYLKYLRSRDIKPVTFHTYWRGIKTFCRYLHIEGYLSTPLKLPHVKKPHTAINPLTQNQLRSLMRWLETNTKSRSGTKVRNVAIFRLFIDTGIRSQELCNIDMQHLKIKDRMVQIVQGKGGKDRWCPFGKETQGALWAYLKTRESMAGEWENALFIAQGGQRMSTRGIHSIMRRVGEAAGIKANVNPHKLRHSFALAYIENGGDPFSLQHILGHTTQTMTSRYVSFSPQNIREQHRKYSPGDQL